MKTKYFILAVLIFSFVFANSAMTQNDTLQVVSSTGEIGSVENIVPITMVNTTIVRGLELTLHYDTNLKFNRVDLTDRTVDFQAYNKADNQTGILHVLLSSSSGGWIDAGDGEILQVIFDVNPNAIPGNYLLNLSDALASDPFYEPITFYEVDGFFTIEGGVIPVQLASFNADYDGQKQIVELKWSTLSEKDNYGFEIQRAEGNSDFVKIGFVTGHGNSTTPQFYTFIDQDVSLTNYQYRLKQIDISGSFQFSPIVSVQIGAPKSFALEQNYPNPFAISSGSAQTFIRFQLPEETKVEIKIFDILGREVQRLLSEKKPAGTHRAIWDGTDRYGKPVSAGVYFYQMTTPNFTDMKKLLILE